LPARSAARNSVFRQYRLLAGSLQIIHAVDNMQG
jgi:hypothetical protein